MRMFPLQDQCDSIIDSAHTILRKFVGLKNSPLLPFTEKLDYLAQFYFQDEVQECSMTLILCLNPTRFFHVTRSQVKYIFHEFVKRPTTPEIDLKQYVSADILGIINTLGTLQYN